MVPICFALVGETVYSAVDRKPKRSPRLKRLDNIRANPGVEVLVDHYEDDWSSLWWVRLRGRAFVVDDGEELARALEALAAKYPQYRVEPPPGPVVAVALDEWKWWHG